MKLIKIEFLWSYKAKKLQESMLWLRNSLVFKKLQNPSTKKQVLTFNLPCSELKSPMRQLWKKLLWLSNPPQRYTLPLRKFRPWLDMLWGKNPMTFPSLEGLYSSTFLVSFPAKSPPTTKATPLWQTIPIVQSSSSEHAVGLSAVDRYPM